MPANSIPVLTLSSENEAFLQNPRDVLAQYPEDLYQSEGVSQIIIKSADLVEDVLRSREHSVDPENSKDDAPAAFLRSDEPHSMLFQDNPTHKRLRSRVSQFFTPKKIKSLSPLVEQAAHELCNEIEKNNQPLDIITSFAEPLPTLIIAQMLGVEPEHTQWFSEVSKLSVNTFFNRDIPAETLKLVETKNQELTKYLEGILEKVRHEPADNIISTMVHDGDEENSLSDAEIIRQARLLLVAGNVTTSDLIGNAVKNFLEHPDQLEALKADPHLFENATEEVLRFDPPVINAGRIAMKEGEVSGCPFSKGDNLSLSLLAANLSGTPEIGDKPMDVFDVHRKKIKVHSFGGGIHFCLGAPLARVEASVGLRVLFERFPNLKAHDKGFLKRKINAFNGMQHYFVTTEMNFNK